MKYTTQTELLVDYRTMVDTLWGAEQSRDFEATISAFKGIWDDLGKDPDFSEFSPIQQAELFRLSGHFLGNYGKDQNRTNYQERAKNLLTKAIEIYGSFNDSEKVADSQNALAMCYLREGAVLEAEAILEQTAADFLDDHLHLIYLQNRGDLLIAKLRQEKYEEAVEIIEEIIVPMEFCKDKKACFVFHEKAGIIFTRIKQFSRAVSHFQNTIRYAEELNNLPFLTSSKNNLANLYRRIGRFDLAHQNEDEAIQIAQENNQIGWLPHYLDTKALIYFDEGKLKSALATINEAISIFQKGEDANGLTEAIWNKCKFLLHLDRKEEALMLFVDLVPIAEQRMGEFAVKNFTKEFSELIHVKHTGSLDNEIKRFKRIEVINAIRQANYVLIEAAQSLKLNIEDLVKILDKEFPELYEELNIEHFSKLKTSKDKSNYGTLRKISQLTLQGSSFSFETEITDEFSTFYISSEKMADVFGVSQDVVVAVVPTKQVIADEYILVHNQENDIYSFGQVNYDSILDLYFLVDKDEPMPLSLDEVDLVGKTVAYFPFSEIDNERIELKPLKF